MTDLKLGMFLPQGWRMDLADVPDPVDKFETMSRCATDAEKAGFDAIWLYDHFHTVPTPQLETTFECWTSMAALARDTSTIRLGQMVTCNSYRPPSLLAKMASCVDVMSHGRLILGIGAGWYQDEYEAYGYDYPETPERLRMLREALQVIVAMWTQDRAEFDGRYYHLRGAINEPKPVQKPHPPIWIGGAGERVTLKLVAQYGDACNFNADVATVRHKLDVLRAHCEAVGRDYDSILKTIEFYMILGDRREVDRVVADTARRTGQEDAFIRSWYPWSGDADYIAEAIRTYVEAGIEYIIVNVPNAFERGVITRFAEEVFPRLGLPGAASSPADDRPRGAAVGRESGLQEERPAQAHHEGMAVAPLDRPTVYEFAGGAPAFLALAAAHHERCLADPELNHPFSHGVNPEHIERLAAYWAEVFGGPARYSASHGGHSTMIGIHAGKGAGEDYGPRFVACFMQAADDVGLPDDPDFRAVLRSYMEWATREVISYAPSGSEVPAQLATPHWSWDGPV